VADVLGMKLSAITEELRSRFKIAENVEGAVIVSVAPGSAAAEKRLEPGDVISEAGERKITTPDDVRNRVRQIKAEGRSSILLLVLKAARQGDPNFIALRLN
jgi:serine protease Do